MSDTNLKIFFADPTADPVAPTQRFASLSLCPSEHFLPNPRKLFPNKKEQRSASRLSQSIPIVIPSEVEGPFVSALESCSSLAVFAAHAIQSAKRKEPRPKSQLLKVYP